MKLSSTLLFLPAAAAWIALTHKPAFAATSNYRELDTPIVNHLLDRIRKSDISRAEYRRISRRLFRILIEESLGEDVKELEAGSGMSVTGSSFKDHVLRYEESEVAVVSIMRSADAMLDEVMEVLPSCKVGKLLLQRKQATRDKQPEFYYAKLPVSIGISPRVFLLDPMLGTGGSAKMAIAKLKQAGVAEVRIVFINLISCPEGIEALEKSYPGVRVITAKVDPILNAKKYIEPGLGDYGDRYFGSNV